MNRFWARMAAIYPGSWSRNFKTEKQLQLAIAEWGRGLADVTDENINLALEKLRGRDSPYPPSLPEFLALCKKQQHGLSHNTAAYEVIKPSRRLEKKPDVGKARVHLETIKGVLK